MMPTELDPSEVASSNPGGDVEMVEGATGEGAENNGESNEVRSELPFAGEGEEAADVRPTFIDYLRSPIVTLSIGPDSGTVLTAHQALLEQSAYFKEACASFIGDGPRSIALPEDNIDAVGCFLEYLYTGEYFPKKLPGQRVLETDPAAPAVDDTGDQLLKHARVHTLAEKFGINALRVLAQSKIHCVNSTARGEIAYARYAYAHTTKENTKVRAPIASFWATRSHMLRSEAEDEFKSLCLENPQFAYDVLTRVLDDKLKRERTDKMHPATSSGRKRARHSSGNA